MSTGTIRRHRRRDQPISYKPEPQAPPVAEPSAILPEITETEAISLEIENTVQSSKREYKRKAKE